MQFRSTIALLVAALGAASACRKAEPAPQQKPAEVAAPAAAAPAPAPAPAPAVIAKPLLWEVEKDGKQLQLLGTFHLGVDAARELPPWVWQRFDAAHTFAMEADVMDPSLLAALRRTDGTTLDQELGAAHWAKLEQAIGADTAARLKTLAASAVTTVVMTHGLPPTAPMDMTLLERARAGGKAIVYLEPVDVQVRVLRWLDGTTLKAMLDDLDGTRARNEKGLAVFRSGDAAAMAEMVAPAEWKAMFRRSDAEVAQAMDEMLYRRNASWIAGIEKLVAAGDAFVAVGAGHLVGDRSVIDLLLAKGYSVTRVIGQ